MEGWLLNCEVMKKWQISQESNLGPLGLEASVLTIRPTGCSILINYLTEDNHILNPVTD